MVSIHVRDLRKVYQVHQRPPGLKAAIKSIFRRTYTNVYAVDGISFDIQEGERVGFLGPNGSGKTTTLKVLSGLLHPTAGEITVDGHTPKRREDAFLKKIMLVTGQKQQLLWDLPPSETWELNRAIYNIPHNQFKEITRELTDLLELGDLISKPTRQLSLGERMKCELASALLHRPKVLFLDEPTIGLDVSMQTTIRAFIKRYNEQYGATLILTSHYMDDVAALCPRIIVIDKGRLSYDGSLGALAHYVRPEKRVSLRFAHPVSPDELAPLGTLITLEGLHAVLQVPEPLVNASITRALASLSITDMTIESAPLEEIMSDFFARSRSAVPLSE